MDMPTSITYEDYNDPPTIQQVHSEEVNNILLHYLEATEVHVFNYRVSTFLLRNLVS